MSDKQTVGSVTYKKVGADYFEQRGLRRYAHEGFARALAVMPR